MNKGKPRITFLAFFLLWAERMRWDVPPLHVRVCVWLESAWLSSDPLLLMMLPRGHAKSTILEVFNAWLYFCWPKTRILHQSESDGTALKTSRGTQNVLRHHPLCRGLLPSALGTVEQWWINGAAEHDARNASMYARGILSNVTSSRADFIQNDDIEVPKNIATPEAREKLRERLGEQVHIAVPGAKTIYIGTPHTHDTVYDAQKKLGARALIVRMFEHEYRIPAATTARHAIPFRPEYVFSGIGEGARLLRENVDYKLEGSVLVLASPGGELLDCYAGAAWPERFDAKEMQQRRRKTRTLSAWDSQYQLHAKPVTNSRLDPSRIVAYDVRPRITRANGAVSMFLGQAHIVGASCRWDPSSGKLKSDVSAVALVLQDETGRRYLHRVEALKGDVAVFAEDGKTIIGGQVWQLCDLLEELHVPRVSVETNGIGAFAPSILRACLKQRGLSGRCGVVALNNTVNKNKRILETLEPLLLSRGTLWGHVDVLNGPFRTQMRDWNPALADQPDDYLDAAAGAIAETPERFRAVARVNGGIPHAEGGQHWRPETGTFEVEFER